MKVTLFTVMCCVVLGTNAQEEKAITVQPTDPPIHYEVISKARVERHNAFKFDPLQMVFGEINFGWEHRISEKMALEFELGPTISNRQRNNRMIYYVPAIGMENFHRKAALGIFTSAALRFYPMKNAGAMNKLYVSPRFKYRRYNEVYISEVADQNDIRGYMNEFQFSFTIGYQLWLTNNFAFDWYAGAGIGTYVGHAYRYDGNAPGMYRWSRIVSPYTDVFGVIGMKVTIGK